MDIKKLNIVGSQEVCKFCRITNQYLQYLVLTGKIPARKVANRWIYLRSDVESFQKQREKKAKFDKRIKLKK